MKRYSCIFTTLLLTLVTLLAGTSVAQNAQFREGKFGKPKVVLPSGLGYTILKEGEGREALLGTQVLVHYTGYFKTGKIFDSSVKRGQPFDFRLGAGEVIEGWDQGVAGMKKGEQRLLFVPSRLAYGRQGVGEIPPNTDLYFEVEFLGVK